MFFFTSVQKGIVCTVKNEQQFEFYNMKGRKKDISILEKFDLKESFWFFD